MNASDPLDTPNRATLNKELKTEKGLFIGNPHVIEQSLADLREGFPALAAAVALSAFAILTELLAFGLAVVTGHIGLAFLHAKADKFGCSSCG